MNIGDTFLPSRINDHLQVVISDPALNAEQLVLVSLTSYDKFRDECRKDASCILQPGDHPGITHTTCVSYRDGRIASEDQLQAMLAAGLIESRAPVGNTVLTRILQGAEKTEELPNKCRSLLEEQRLIQG